MIFRKVNLAVLATGLLLLSSCHSEPQFENNGKPSASIDAKRSTDEDRNDDDAVDEPVSVAGAFLFCAIDQDLPVSQESNSGLGCRLSDKDGRPIVLKKEYKVSAILITIDGQRKQLMLFQSDSIFWHWVYEAPTTELLGGSIEMTSSDEDLIWGEAKRVQIVEKTNDLQAQLDLVYMMIADHEASLADLQADVDSKNQKVDEMKSSVQKLEEEKIQLKEDRDIATKLSEEKTATHKQSVEALKNAEKTLDEITLKLTSATESRDTAAAALMSAEQAILDAQTQQEIDAAIASRDQVLIEFQSAEAMLAEIQASETQAIDDVTIAQKQAEAAKKDMDAANTVLFVATLRLAEGAESHSDAVSDLEDATTLLEEATTARDRVSSKLSELRLEAERLISEIHRQ